MFLISPKLRYSIKASWSETVQITNMLRKYFVEGGVTPVGLVSLETCINGSPFNPSFPLLGM